MYRQSKLLSYLLHLCGAQVPQVPISVWTNKPTIHSCFILSEEMREEHERITARFCPTDGAIVCCWMTGNVNESERQQGTGRKTYTACV